jgi:hypothetical protein
MPCMPAPPLDVAPDPPLGAKGLRVNGLVLLLLLVSAGMGITSVYYHWKAPAIVAQRRAELAAMSKEPEPMLEMWLQWGAPGIHYRLQQMRISASTPWLATHAQASTSGDQPPLLWGIDLTDLSPAWVRREGLNVIVDLPAPRLLGRAWIGPDKEPGVIKVAPQTPAPSPEACATRVREICEFALERLVKALPEDIPGASVEVRVAPSPEAQ